MSKATPAARANARRDPAVFLPPPAPRTSRDLQALRLRVAGTAFLIGPRLVKEGCELAFTLDGTATCTLRVYDPDGGVLGALTDHTQRLVDGARVIIDDVSYVLRSVKTNEDLSIDLLFDDEVAWRLRLFARYKSLSRKRSTRAQFVLSLVTEAGRAPAPPMRAWIPELTDHQVIARPEPQAA